MFEDKHWNRGAIECLDSLMEEMVDCRRLGIFSLRSSAGTGVVVVLPGNTRRVYGIASRTEQGGCLGYSVLDAGLSCTKEVWYIYDWDTG